MMQLQYGDDIIYVLSEDGEKPVKIVMEKQFINKPKHTLEELVYLVESSNIGLFTLE